MAISWVAAVWHTDLRLDAYGIARSLSPIWYGGAVAGLVGLIVAFKSRVSGYAAGFAVMLIMYLAMTAFILEQTPRFHYIFTSHAYADQVLDTGRIDYAQSYLAWPGWHIVAAATVDAGSWDVATFLQWTSPLLTGISAAAVVGLIARMSDSRAGFWASLVVLVSLSGAPAFPLPGTMAGILWILMVSVVADEYLSEREPSAGRRLIGLVLAVGVVVTHMLTTVVMIASVVMVLGAGWILGRHRVRANVALFAVAVAVIYLFYLATEVTARLLPQQVEAVLHLDRLFSSTVTSTAEGVLLGAEEHTRVVLVRIAYVAVPSLLAALAIATMLLRGRIRLRRWWFPGAMIAAALATLLVGPYSGEIIARAYGFASLGVVAFVGSIVATRWGWTLAPVLIVGVLFSPINGYGNELLDHLRPQELAADRFVREFGPASYALVGASRTLGADWQAPGDRPKSVTVTGPLYGTLREVLGSEREPTLFFGWQYDNGAVRVAVR